MCSRSSECDGTAGCGWQSSGRGRRNEYNRAHMAVWPMILCARCGGGTADGGAIGGMETQPEVDENVLMLLQYLYQLRSHVMCEESSVPGER